MNIDCSEASRLISRKIDRAITDEEAQALERHLSECSTCRLEWGDQQRLAEAITALPDSHAPAGFGERLKQAVSAEAYRAGRGPTSFVFRIMALAATFMLAVGVLYLAAELKSSRAESARLSSALNAMRSHQVGMQAVMRDAPRITPTEMAVVEQLQSFRAVRDFVGGAMRWMVTDGDQLEIGMRGGSAAETVTKCATGEEREAIVLAFEYRELARGEPARVLSNPEFVLFSGDEVSVRLKGRSAGEPILRYRVFAERLIGGSIRTEINFANEAISRDDVNGSLVVRTLLTPGKPVLIGAGGDADRRWELFVWGVARPESYRGPQKDAKPL